MALFPASARQVAWNYLSAVALLVPVYGFYQLVPYYESVIGRPGLHGLTYVLFAYLLALPIFYATFPDSYTVKCRRFWQAVRTRNRPWSDVEKVALQAVGVKAFFLPLMIGWSITHSQNLAEAWHDLLSGGVTFRHVYMLAFLVILIGDVGCFTIGYAVEHPKLGNEIRSVEPTIGGWLAALACYPPLHIITARVYGWYATDYPEFESLWLQVSFGIVMLTLIGIYSWASLALGFKASNLTNRGIVTTGPFAFVRHPAYVAKNLFWVLSAIPVIGYRMWSEPRILLAAAFGLTGWCALYVLRAITEERHLRADPDYVAYCQKVRWRFIPGLL